MKNDGEMADWNVLGMGRNEKYAEQWCFSIVKITGEGLLTNGVSATEEESRNKCWTELFRK
jgi:hypothetical protein